jgi:predicted RNA binding protein YcfA (HicA-like mRNA interferase family)
MTFSELTRLLRDHGWVFVRQGKGSAQIWHPS